MLGHLPDFLTAPNPEIYLSDNYVVLDFETTTVGKGLPVYAANRIVLAVWRLGPKHPARQRGASHLHCRRAGEYELADLVRHIEEADFVAAHNTKFELGWLERCGLDIGETLPYCTMLGEYVLGGNTWVKNQLSLENIAQRRWGEGKVGVVSSLIKAGVPVEDIPEEWLLRYCIKDVELTEQLLREQREDLFTSGKLPVAYNRNILTPVLVDISSKGLMLDAEAVEEKINEVLPEYNSLTQQLDSFTGGINFASTKQLAEYLYTTLGFDEVKDYKAGKWVPRRTKGGNPSTDVETLGRLKPKTKEQRKFLELYNRVTGLHNELTKYLRKFQECCQQAGGVMLAEFNQTSTRTHRLSSTGLEYKTQFQNLQRDYKPLFRARRDGWLVGEGDGAQLEFRVAAHLGRCAAAIKSILEGVDVHSVTASIIGVSRQEAKAHTFKPLYGGQSGTDAEKEYYQYFRDTYTGITRTQNKWIDTVLEHKSLRTEWGLEYFWPDTRRDKSGYVKNSTSICNYPVQAFATAEIIPAGLVFMWHRIRRIDGVRMFLVNTVHDSIIAELPPEEVELFHALVKQCLIDDVYFFMKALYDIDLVVPLGAGVKVATRWGGKDAADYVPEGVEHDKGEVKYVAEDHLWQQAA